MSKYLIFGSRSYLGSQFKKYLDEKNIVNYAIDANNSDNYSASNIVKILNSYEPTKIVDFKFLKVSSNDNDFIHFKEKDFFQPQMNLIQSINETNIRLNKLLYISTAGSNTNLYTNLKRKQEKIYKKHLKNNKVLSILKLNTVFGPGDKSKTRLIPTFFYKILKDKYVELNINSNKNGDFIYIKNTMDKVYNCTLNIDLEIDIFRIKYKNLVQTLSYIIKSVFNYDHKILWNDKELNPIKVIENDKFYKNLIKTADWYMNESKI